MGEVVEAATASGDAVRRGSAGGHRRGAAVTGRHRGRRLGHRLEPARARRGGGARRARRRDRAGLRRSGLPGARLGGGAGDRHGAACRAATTRPSPRPLAAVAPDAVVLAGYMRIVGPAVLAAFAGRILNTHPSLLPAFPGGHAVADALAHGVTVTGCTVHLVDATLDGGPIVAQEAVPDPAGRRRRDAPRADPGRRAPAAAAGRGAPARRGGRGGAGRPTRRPGPRTGRRRVPVPRRALLSVSDKTGLVEPSPVGSSRRASSWSRPAARPGRCATPACRSPTSRP